MELRENDNEKLVLTTEDIKTLYVQLRLMMFIPKSGISLDRFEFFKKFWHAISLVATPDEMDEEKEEFKKK